MKNQKKKGSDAERELIHLFWKNEWAAARIAGSGSMKYPSPDIIAGKTGTLYVIECKTTKLKSQYFEKKEINELKEFSKIIIAIPYTAVKFQKEEWRFYPLINLKETEKNYVVNTKSVYLSFNDLLKK